MVYWEITRACDLACIHCRADAVHRRHPLELSTEEGMDVLDQIASFRSSAPSGRAPHLVITGGDPMRRPDLVELVARATQLGIPVSMTPAGTPRFTSSAIDRISQAGISTIAVSIDGSDARRHDGFRGVNGSFNWTLEVARSAVRKGVPLQVNTMVTADTYDDLKDIFALVRDMGISRWALFFLIATGRGGRLAGIDRNETQSLLEWIGELSDTRSAPFPVKTTEAPFVRRHFIERATAAGVSGDHIRRSPAGRGFGIRDGNGIVFISHTGEVYPSGFLPLKLGSVRERSLADIYRNHPTIRDLRNPQLFRGACGSCPFREECGGSRARAYAATGDPLESDPLCPYA